MPILSFNCFPVSLCTGRIYSKLSPGLSALKKKRWWLMCSFSCAHNGRGWSPGSSAFFRNSGQKTVFIPYWESNEHCRGSASLQGTCCSAAARLLLRSHTCAVTQIPFAFRHYPAAALCHQDSFPLPEYLGKKPQTGGMGTCDYSWWLGKEKN